jgi:hypothetical protein
MLPNTPILFLDLDVSDLRAEGDMDARCSIRAVGATGNGVLAVGMTSVEAAEDLMEARGYRHSSGAIWRRA